MRLWRPPNVTRRTDVPCDAPLALRTAIATGLVVTLVGLSACSTVSDSLTSSKVDYRAASTKTAPLDVPPDLTQLTNDPRYQPPSGTSVSATALQTRGTAASPAAAPATSAVAPNSAGKLRIERAGNQRWLVSPLPPETLWPLLRTYWQDNGFTLVDDRPEVGVMETDWTENRAKLPQDFIRRTLGRVIDSLYDTGERDRFRTRIERTPQGSEIYISHRSSVELAVGDRSNETTRWQVRPGDPQLEAEMLSRLMLKLAGPVDATKPSAQNVATASQSIMAAPETPARARVLNNATAASLQVDDAFDRAWRRIGLALDRGGFTVEDRDRTQGVYFVRYVDPKLAGQEEPGLFARMLGVKRQDLSGTRYRLKVVAAGTAASTVTVLDTNGAGLNDDGARSIISLLVTELR